MTDYPKGIEITVSPIIVNDAGEVAVQKSWKWNWGFCGGHCEPGETLADAVVRETKEELGMDVEVMEQLCMREVIQSAQSNLKNKHYISFYFLCKPKPGSEIEIDNEEIKENLWVDLDTALEMVIDDCKPPLQILIERRKND